MLPSICGATSALSGRDPGHFPPQGYRAAETGMGIGRGEPSSPTPSFYTKGNRYQRGEEMSVSSASPLAAGLLGPPRGLILCTPTSYSSLTMIFLKLLMVAYV